MKISSLIFILIILLPFTPHWYNTNFDYLILSILILLLVSKIKITALTSLSFTEYGFAMLGCAALFSIVQKMYCLQSPIIEVSLFTILFPVLIFLSFRFTDVKLTSLIYRSLELAFMGLSAFILFKGYQLDFNYHALTSVLNYHNGFGNISQLAMCLSFFLICIDILLNSPKRKIIYLPICVTVAMVLKSKLLVLVLIFCVLNNIRFRRLSMQRLMAFSSVIIGILGYLFLDALEGRRNLQLINLRQIDYTNLLGEGISSYENFINTAFAEGREINVVGEVWHLAFNDYIQVFVELGYLGIGGLIIIFIGLLLYSKHIFHVLALAVILMVMFPLQYIETSALFGLTIFVLVNNSKRNQDVIPKQKRHSTRKKIAVGIVAALTILITWSTIDSLIWFKNFYAFKQNSSITNINFVDDNSLSNTHNDKKLLALGKSFYQIGKIENATDIFLKAEQINISYDSQIHLGDCYFKKSKFRKAMEYYNKANKLRPAKLYPIYKSIYCLMNEDSKEKAYDFWLSKKDNFELVYSGYMDTMKKEIEKLFNDL